MSPVPGETDILTRYAFLPMESSHLDEVMAIELASHTRPWTRKGFEHEIDNNPMSWPRVAVTIGPTFEVAGYCVVWFVFEHLQIQNVAVHREHRRRGLGRFLVLSALEEGVVRGVTSALLEVRPSNEPAQNMYRELGFRQTGEREGYYSEPFEDALLFQRELSHE